MTEHPILFSTPMVQAILEERKTQTRRVIKKPMKLPDNCIPELLTDTKKIMASWCPYGQVGDHLWVRETWSPWADEETQIACSGEDEKCIYKADYKTDAPCVELGGDYHWHPSIFMPRWASRITLEINNIRVERVQEITLRETISEGIQIPVTPDGHLLLNVSSDFCPADYLPRGLLKDFKPTEEQWMKAHFASLWDSINSKRGYSWDSNPWVWVIEFKRLP